MNETGKIVDKVTIGKDWWKKIEYDADEFRKKREKHGWKAISEMLLSGDLIQKLWRWKGHIIAQIVRNGYDEPFNTFMIISSDFKKQSPLITRGDYQFCGAGKYIYLAKLLDLDRKNEKKIVEVLQCDCEF